MNKLTYTTLSALFAAYKAGATFAVSDGRSIRTVTKIEQGPTANVLHVSVLGASGVYTGFRADGTNVFTGAVLTQTSAPSTEPFLKRFVNGEPAYNPATREVVVGVSFVSGAIEVLLKNEAGIERVSTKYDHEGRHRWVPGRSLVLGKLPPAPPKMKKVELRIYEDRATGGFFLLTPDQNLPNYSRLAGLAPLKTVEVEVKA